MFLCLQTVNNNNTTASHGIKIVYYKKKYRTINNVLKLIMILLYTHTVFERNVVSDENESKRKNEKNVLTRVH